MVEYDLRHHYQERKRSRVDTAPEFVLPRKRTRLHDLEKPLEAIGLTEEAHLVEEVADLVDEAEEWWDEVTNPVPEAPNNQLGTNQDSVRAVSSRVHPGNLGKGFTRITRMARRRFRGRRRGRRRPTFRRKVKGVLLGMTETKRILDSVQQTTLSCGDGTTRVLYIANTVSQLINGSDNNEVDGNTIWIKGLWLRGRVALDQTTNTLKIRIMCIATRQFADLPVGLTTYGNTTTAITNPAQAPGLTNIRMFESDAAEIAAQPSAPYVGNASGIDILDTDYVKVLKVQEIWMSPDKTLPFRDVDLYVPINRRWSFQTDFDEGPADQLRSFRNMNYYWVIQVFSNSNANNILVAQDILFTGDMILYFKDI
jgi:hypothetical protein